MAVKKKTCTSIFTSFTLKIKIIFFQSIIIRKCNKKVYHQKVSINYRISIIKRQYIYNHSDI